MAKPLEPAFVDSRRRSESQGIITVIEAMEDKQVKLSSEHFTAEELLDLFVEPAYHKTLTDAWDLVEPSGSTQELYTIVDRPSYATFTYKKDGTVGSTVSPATMSFKFTWHRHNCEHCFYVPRRGGAGKDTAVRFRPEAKRDLIEKFMTVTMDLCDVHWRFSQALLVFRRLNDICRTPAQMRYVWPCIHMLCRKAGLDEIADEIAEADARAGDKVRVPTYLIPLLKPTNDTIAKTVFLDGIEPGPNPPIKYTLDHNFDRY